MNREVLMRMQGDLLDMVYPIGRGFIDFTDTDYSRYLGFTWERELLGMFPLGADDTNYKIGNTGGSRTKTLSVAEMPSHNHTFTGSPSTASGTLTRAGHLVVANDLNGGTTRKYQLRGDYGQSTHEDYYNVTVTLTPNGSIGYTGQGKAFDIMPPYKTVYYWKRVA